METLKKMKIEKKDWKRRARGNYSPYRKYINTLEELIEILENKITKEIIEATKISLTSKRLSKKRQLELQKLGFILKFRGFNSLSCDRYIYQNENKKWFYSIGLCSVKNAGRGYEIKI